MNSGSQQLNDKLQNLNLDDSLETVLKSFDCDEVDD